MTTLLGLDLSLTATGWALHEGSRGALRTGPIATTAAEPLGVRLDRIVTGVASHLHHQPALIVIEDLPTNAHGAGKTGMVHGAVRHWLHVDADGPWPVLTVPPATLKTFATGKGNANKVAMALALAARTGVELDDDNQVDAAWLALLGHHALGQPLLELPKTHTRALHKLDLDHLAVATR